MCVCMYIYIYKHIYIFKNIVSRALKDKALYTFVLSIYKQFKANSNYHRKAVQKAFLHAIKWKSMAGYLYHTCCVTVRHIVIMIQKPGMLALINTNTSSGGKLALA